MGVSPMKELAGRLTALEIGRKPASKSDASSTCMVCEKLRQQLTTMMGSGGYASLMRRALALASRETPALQGVHVLADGSLEGLNGNAVEVNSVLVACLLNLLTTFIGEVLTMRLLHDMWPELLYIEPETPGKELE